MSISNDFLKIKTFGNSMFPFLMDADVLYVKRTPFSKLSINDFVTFLENKKFITHRIIFKSRLGLKPYIITKGDANLQPDKKVVPKQILGKVYKIKRAGAIFDPEQIYLFQSTLYFNEILKVKKVFEKNNIELVFLKGLPINLYLEKTHPKRIYADCDLLIKKQEFNKVSRILKKLGFSTIETTITKTHAKLRTKEPEVSFSKTIDNIRITLDIHLEAAFLIHTLGKMDSIYPQVLIDKLTEAFLKEKKVIRIYNENFFILPTENLIIYLALHLFHHNLRGYYRYNLISKVLTKNKVDFNLMAEKIYEYNLRNFIYPVFILLIKYYKIPIPKKFLNRILPSAGKIRYINNHILNIDIFSEEFRVDSGIERFKFFFHLSPVNPYLKYFIFLQPGVLYTILWILKSRIYFTAKIFFSNKVSINNFKSFLASASVIS